MFVFKEIGNSDKNKPKNNQDNVEYYGLSDIGFLKDIFGKDMIKPGKNYKGQDKRMLLKVSF